MPPPIGLRWRSNTFFIIATVGMGMFTDLFLFSLVVPVFPFMLKDRLRTPPEQMQTLVDIMLSIYAAASVLASPIAGFLSDRIAATRQTLFLFGLSALFLSTIMLAVGRSIIVLAIARFLQGASSGIVWTIGLAMCLETVGAENLGKTIGTIFSFVTCGTIFAPVLGGLLYEKTGYTGVFALGVLLLVVDLIMRLLVIERKVAAKYTSVEDGNHVGPATETTSLLARSGQSNSEVEVAYKIDPPSNKLLASLPILACLKSPALLVALLIGLCQAFLLAGFDATVPLIASEWYGFTSLKAGLLFLPLGAADLIIGPLAGWAIDRFGTKPASLIGFTVLTPAFALMRLPQPGGSYQIALYCSLLTLCGIGITVAGTPAIVESGAVMERYHKANADLFGENGPYAQLYGISSMMFSVGLTLGPLVIGGLRERIGYGNMNTVLAGICFAMAISSGLFIGRPINWRSGLFSSAHKII